MNNVVHLQIIERKALGLYVLAGAVGRAGDFIEALIECESVPVLEFLYEFCTHENPKQSERDKETNRLAAPVVQSRLDKLKETTV